MPDSVYKVIELIGTSSDSWEKAAANAVGQAAKTLRDLRIAEVVKLDMQLDEKGNVEVLSRQAQRLVQVRGVLSLGTSPPLAGRGWLAGERRAAIREAAPWSDREPVCFDAWDGNCNAWWPHVHRHSQVHQGSFGRGRCPPRQERRRSDPEAIARIQILLRAGWGRRRWCRRDDIRGPRKRQCSERQDNGVYSSKSARPRSWGSRNHCRRSVGKYRT